MTVASLPVPAVVGTAISPMLLGLTRCPVDCMEGATVYLRIYIATAPAKHFQPMGSNMGLLQNVGERIKDKKLKYKKLSDIALNKLDEVIKENSIN